MNQNELYHYGVLGMKWGVRNYQNSDGSLTDAGKRHYGINGKNPKADARKSAAIKRDYQRDKLNKKYNSEIAKINNQKNTLSKSEILKKKETAVNKYRESNSKINDEFYQKWAKNESVGHIIATAVIKSAGSNLASSATNAVYGGMLSVPITIANSIVNAGIGVEMISDLINYSKYK